MEYQAKCILCGQEAQTEFRAEYGRVTLYDCSQRCGYFYITRQAEKRLEGDGRFRKRGPIPPEERLEVTRAVQAARKEPKDAPLIHDGPDDPVPPNFKGPTVDMWVPLPPRD